MTNSIFKTNGPRTIVGLVIDRSGSMDSLRGAIIEGHNDLIRKTREEAAGQEVAVYRCLFDYPDQIEVVGPMGLADVVDLNYENYVPRGNTALNDAIGATVQAMQQHKLRKKDAALLIIVTDGYENASLKYNTTEVNSMLEDLKATDQWTVVYIGANVDLHRVRTDYGYSVHNAASFVATPAGTRGVLNAVSASTGVYFAERERGMTSTEAFLTPKTPDSTTFLDKAEVKS